MRSSHALIGLLVAIVLAIPSSALAKGNGHGNAGKGGGAGASCTVQSYSYDSGGSPGNHRLTGTETHIRRSSAAE